MPFKIEIERKFLVLHDKLPPLPPAFELVQGYLSLDPSATIRIRLQQEEDSNKNLAFLTIKGRGLVGRDEFEYEIPFEEAQQMLKLSQTSLVEKRRYILPAEVQNGTSGLKWELDIFEGANSGLITAEIELPNEFSHFKRPDWLGQEVTEDPAYKNSSLAQIPYRNWPKP